jgi:hypothetical protein
MENYFSIVRFVNNPLSDESIALGLIVLTAGKQSGAGSGTFEAQAMFRLSEAKVAFAKKLNPGSARLLDFSLKQLHSFLSLELQDQTYRAIQFPVRVKHSFLERLSDYNNGILQFSKPRYIESSTIATAFDDYFARFIEPQALVPEQVKNVVESQLKVQVEKNFYQPLRGQIDVDYTLQKKQLPSLYFDFHLEGIGVNGAMYAVKAIDLNGTQQLDTIRNELSEYESVIERLNLFAEERKISGKAHYYLVTDPYEGKNKDRKELYSLLTNVKMPSFEVIASEGLPGIVRDFRQKNVRKFSEVVG